MAEGISCCLADTQTLRNVSTALLLAVSAGGLHQVKGNPILSAHNAAKGLIPDLKVHLHTAKGQTLVDLKGMLDSYVEGKKGFLSKIQETFAGEEHDRAVELSKLLEREGVWPVEDREEEARVLISRFDKKGTAHCGATFESAEQLDAHFEACQYRLVECPNQGCAEKVSAYRLDAHDGTCGHKLLPCGLECGDLVARAGMAQCEPLPAAHELSARHEKEACPNRAADCPYKDLGCIDHLCAPPPRTVGGVEGHVKGCVHGHLALVAEENRALRKQLEELEDKVADMMKQMGDQAAAMKSSQALLDKDTKELKALPGVAKSVSSLEKEVRTLKKETATEIAKVFKAIHDDRKD